jgi:hypothetical protein
MTSKSGKREYPRENALIIAEYTTSKENALCLIKNISAGGLFVKTSWKLDVGQPITLKFPLFDIDENITVSGTVSRIEPAGFAVAFDKSIDGLVGEEGQFPTIVNEGDR